MSSNFRLFKRQLDESLELVDAVLGAGDEESFELSESINAFPAAHSLLARCESVCKKYEKGKPKIRIIHHLASSGGSLISKCISALPNVYLLSEVHPTTTLHIDRDTPQFSATDLVTVGRYAGIPNIDEFANEHFLSAISLINRHVSSYGGTVVLRDHCHSDFCVAHPPSKHRGIVAVLQNTFEVQSVLTVRDPIDCYLSLLSTGWIHFSPATFNEYCRRTLVFLDSYPDAEVLRYEDFVSSPKVIFKQLCDAISLPYNDNFAEIFDAFKVTGDSGRSGSAIAPRERRQIDENLKREIRKSTYYRNIADKFGYLST